MKTGNLWKRSLYVLLYGGDHLVAMVHLVAFINELMAANMSRKIASIV